MRKLDAYVCNFESGTVSIIDLESRYLRNIPVGNDPIFNIPYYHDREKLIVALHNHKLRDGGGILKLVNLNANSIIREIRYPGRAMPSGMVYDGTGDMLYVADEHLCRINVHDGKTLDLHYSLPAGLVPVHVDISNDGRYLVATNRKSADLYVYDLEQSPITAEWGIAAVHLGHTPGMKLFEDVDASICSPYDVKFTEEPNICYVTNYAETGELLVIDISKRIVTDRIRVGAYPFGMTLDKAGDTAYVCNQSRSSSSVSFVDLSSKKVVGEIKGLISGPSHCAIDETRRQLVVTCQSGAVQFIDLESETVIHTVMDEMLRAPIGITIG